MKAKRAKAAFFPFSISFDKGSEEEINPEPTPAETDRITLAGRRILVAEDQAYNLELIQTILEKWACKIEAVTNGLDALELLKHRTFDAVLLDIQMPGMSGLEVLSAVRSEKILQQDIPFIAVTAGTDKGVIRRLLSAGFQDVLAKPYKEESLFKALISGMPQQQGDIEAGVGRTP